MSSVVVRSSCDVVVCSMCVKVHLCMDMLTDSERSVAVKSS